MPKKVLIVYFSLSGNTEKMAQYISEGLRMSGQQATVKKVSDLRNVEDIVGYDGYIFGSPTYYRDIAEPMKQFLFLAKKANLQGKPGGAFGSYTHDGNAAGMVFDTMQHVFHMEPFDLGPLNIKDTMLEQPGREHKDTKIYVAGEVHGDPREGMKACQDYGKAFGENLGT